ncbi:hypothetical protein [Arcobacter sp. FWKO B]|uniref:hypothetical protein n=1 Tax=Arcobacter sp. FWKO B TaxID=2593672 RepID=UPI0018A5A885|nr:hypothetical protein [Arcobacter sp. FWKO B]QOG13042.1 hypothetical protein FWKOB_10230 [Arcobacter sp. FWKO B]
MSSKQFKQIISSITIVVILSGCSVKQTDSITTKTIKHTVNSPAYVLVGTGYLAETAIIFAVGGTLYSIKYTHKYFSDILSSSGNKEESNLSQ